MRARTKIPPDPAAAARLKSARLAKGLESGAAAARFLGLPEPTYAAYENGSNGYARHARDFARRFGVSLEWLLSGRGEMRPARTAEGLSIEIDGLVGAGGAVQEIGDPTEPAGSVDLPTGLNIGALVVRGESQWPRFLDGETVLYDRRPVLPQEMIGRYAVVQTEDGRRMLKIVKRGSREGVYTLASHNAPDEENVRLIGAWRYLLTLAADGGRAR